MRKKLSLVPCTRAEARVTWQKQVTDKDIPRSSRYARVVEGGREVGMVVWSGTSRVQIRWLTIYPGFRGRGLQRRVRAMVGRLSARAAGGTCAVYTYANVWNLASIRNIIYTGGMPYRVTIDKEGSVFMHFKQRVTR